MGIPRVTAVSCKGHALHSGCTGKLIIIFLNIIRTPNYLLVRVRPMITIFPVFTIFTQICHFSFLIWDHKNRKEQSTDSCIPNLSYFICMLLGRDLPTVPTYEIKNWPTRPPNCSRFSIRNYTTESLKVKNYF